MKQAIAIVMFAAALCVQAGEYRPFDATRTSGAWWEADGQQVHIDANSDSGSVRIGFNVGNLLAPLFARSIAGTSYEEELFDPFDLSAGIWNDTDSKWVRTEWDAHPQELFETAMLDAAEHFGMAQAGDGESTDSAGESLLSSENWVELNKRVAARKIVEANRLLDEYGSHWDRNWEKYAFGSLGAIAGYAGTELSGGDDDKTPRIDTGGGDYVGRDKTTTTTTTSNHSE